MNNIITYSFCENFLDRLADYIDENYVRPGKDLSRLAIVFGGRRPSLFLKRELARRINAAYIPPRFFTIDEFLSYTVHRKETFAAVQDLDQCYLLYRLVKEVAPDIIVGREAFAQFLPWTREVLHFIDQLDLEQVTDQSLADIQAAARIGYPVPEDINRLLKQIVKVRQAYHEQMKSSAVYSRGYQYRRAAELVSDVDFAEFDEIFFCNFFYFNRSEEAVVKNLYDRGKVKFFFQGDERRWPILKRIAGRLGNSIVEGSEPATPQFKLQLHSGFDIHSQIGLAREILKNIPRLEKTVIVVPAAEHVVPLLSQIAGEVADFNVSMGYPLKRSSLYSLFDMVFAAQLSRRDDGYYARDYLKVLRHPLVKNLKCGGGATATRILVHKIEEILTGEIKTALSGCLFIKPDEMAVLDDLYLLVGETLRGMGEEVNRAELELTLRTIHHEILCRWEGVRHFSDFADALGQMLNLLLEKSFLSSYPLNLNIAARIQDIVGEMKTTAFREEAFPSRDIFRIFAAKMEREIVAFQGSPLKGLQILGLFETRSLNFDHVIVLDTNEGVLPHVNIYEPLIPREVMLSLKLDRLEQEEEMQRYQFLRLISSAKTVHLIYQENREKERSRFVEELVWEEQKKKDSLEVVSVVRAGFAAEPLRQKKEVAKTPAVVAFLQKMRYSSSSVNTYVRNPMEFYDRYVLGLEEKEDLLDEPENRQVGIFVHELLEETFKNFVRRRPVIDEKFRQYFKAMYEERFASVFGKTMRSDAFLLKTVLDVRLERFLENEATNPERRVKEVLFVEEGFEDVVNLSCGDIRFIYKVDRVDRMEDGTVMILDYKTGSVDPMPKGIERIERLELSRETIKDTVKSFQIPLYFYYLEKYFKGEEVNAAFYNLRTLELNKFLDRKMSFDRERIHSAFRRPLDFIMAEILDPKIPFVADEDSV